MTDRQLKTLKQLRTRHGRRKCGCILAEGVRCCTEALHRQSAALQFAVCSEAFASDLELNGFEELLPATPEVVSEAMFADIAVTDNPQGILCVFTRPEILAPTALRGPFVLILDRLREPGNTGAILRTAWAAGLQDVWLTSGSADPYNPKAVRAGMGAQFALTIHAVGDLAEAQSRLTRLGGNSLWLTVPGGGVSCYSDEFQLPGSGLVIGNEADGIVDMDRGMPVSIPMPGKAESLNVAQAAAIFLFEGVRRGLLGES